MSSKYMNRFTSRESKYSTKIDEIKTFNEVQDLVHILLKQKEHGLRSRWLDWIEQDISRVSDDIKLFTEIMDICLNDKSNIPKAIRVFVWCCLKVSNTKFYELTKTLHVKIQDIFLNYSSKDDLLDILPNITFLFAFHEYEVKEYKFLINECLNKIRDHIYQTDDTDVHNHLELYEYIRTFLMLLLQIRDKPTQLSIVDDSYNDLIELLDHEDIRIVKVIVKLFVIFHEILYNDRSYSPKENLLKGLKRAKNTKDFTFVENKELESYINDIENDHYQISAEDRSVKFLSKNVKSFLIGLNIYCIKYSTGYIFTYFQKTLKLPFKNIVQLLGDRFEYDEIDTKKLHKEDDLREDDLFKFNLHFDDTMSRQKKKNYLCDI